MSLLPSDVLLGGVRVGSSNNATTYTPDGIIKNQALLNEIPDAEIGAWVTGVNPDTNFILITDPNLKFFVSLNKVGLPRFGYSDSDKRWDSLPGGPPIEIGVISNTNRLNVGSVSENFLSESPVALTCGIPPLLTFVITFVNTNSNFTDVPSGTVQISRDTWDLNFSEVDVNNQLYQETPIYWFSQFCNGFNDIPTISIPVKSIDSDVYLRPIPSGNWAPRLSYGNRNDLIETSTSPIRGQFQNLGGGRFRLNAEDIQEFSEDLLIYRGLVQGPRSLSVSAIGNSQVLWPNPCVTDTRFVGLTSPAKYLLALKSGNKYFYLQNVLVDEIPLSVGRNSPYAYINVNTGEVYITKNFGSGPLVLVDCDLDTGFGASFRLSPSILNAGRVATYTDFSEWVNRKDYPVVDSVRGNRVNLQDSVNESYDYSFNLVNGKSSGRTGRLLDLENTESSGYGYALNALNKTMILGQRSSESHEVTSNNVKLKYNAYFNTNLNLSDENYNEIDPDSYELNTDGGLVTFTTSYGRGRKRLISYRNTVSGKSISISDQNITNTNPSHIGIDGIIYKVTSKSGSTIFIGESLADSNDKKIDIYIDLFLAAKDSVEYFIIPPTNFHLYKSTSQSGPFTELNVNEYSVLEGNGQIRLNASSEPDTFYRTTYETIFNDSLVTRDEFLLTEVTNEQCSPTDVPSTWTFNPDNRVLGFPAVINVIVKGSELPPNNYRVEGNTIYLSSDPGTQSILVSYNVLNSAGGKRTFQASANNIYLNSPKFANSLNAFTFPGNYTDRINNSSILAFDDKSCWLVTSSVYDSAKDITLVTINTPLNNNKNVSIAVLDPSDPELIRVISTKVSIAVSTNSVLLPGQLAVHKNCFIYLNDDPYLVSSVEYQKSSNRTKILLYTATTKNYSKASVRYTYVPVVLNAEVELGSLPAPETTIEVFTVGKTKGIELPASNFTLTTNKVTVNSPIGHDYVYVSLEAIATPSYTTLNFTGSHQISPDSINRIVGQKIIGTYKIHSPDSFYFRTYTYLSFSSEISNLASGGRINGNGNPSITFQYTSLVLADVVLNAFVKYFNDFVNYYESLRENSLGTPIGGSTYKFRYDGNLNNPRRDEYWQLTNHIDDEIYIRTRVRRFLFIVRRTRIYSRMYDYNRFSRFFRNYADVVVQVDSNTSTNGAVVASTGFTNITNYTEAYLVPNQARIKTRQDYDRFVVINGDPNKDMPPVSVGNVLRYFNKNYINVGSVTVTNVEVLDPNTGLSVILTTGGTSIPLENNAGYLIGAANTEPYVTFRVDSESGDIVSTGEVKFGSQVLYPAIPPNSYIRLSVSYNPTNTSIDDIPVLNGEVYKDDGSFDDGYRLFDHERDINSIETYLVGPSNQARVGNGSIDSLYIYLLLDGVYEGSDIYIMSGLNRGKTVRLTRFITSGQFEYRGTSIVPDDATFFSSGVDIIPDVRARYTNAIESDIPLAVGSTVYFESGPNLGRFTINNRFNNIYTVSKVLSVDLVPRSLKRDAVGINVPSIFNNYYKLFVSNASTPASVANKFGTNDSTFTLLRKLSRSFGPEYKSGSFNVDADVVTILGSPYSIPDNSYFIVEEGINQGVYAVSKVTANGFTIKTGGNFYAFYSPGTVTGKIYTLYSFLDPIVVEPISKIWRETLLFWFSTNNFYYDPSKSKFQLRSTELVNRLNQIENYWNLLVETLSTSSNTYEVRKTWMIQRADKVNGIVSKKAQELKNINNKLSTLRQDLLRQIVLAGV